MKVKMRFYILVITLSILFGGGILYKNTEQVKNNTNADITEKSITIKQNKDISINFVGDILLAGHVGDKINQNGVNYPFSMVKNILASSDISVGNLESAAAISGVSVENKQYTFRAHPKVLEGVKWSGIDVLTLANNHILDFGTEAFYETLKNIRDAGLKYIGAGKDESEAYRPEIQEIKGKKIAIFSVSRVVPTVDWHSGKNWRGVASVYSTDKLVSRMKTIEDQVDLIAVYIHWGVEREVMPEDYQRVLAKKLIDNGADLVVGSHPHVLQGFEYYKGKIIAYSLGNFVFTNIKNDTLILNINYKEDGTISARIIPCIIKNYIPQPIESDTEKQKFYNMIEERSFGIEIDTNGTIVSVQ